MANSWLRLWHELPNDPKWRTIARISKQPTASVIAVYIHLLVGASQSSKRGTVAPNTEDLSSALDLSIDSVQGILDAMQGRVLDGENITGWDKRQPEREDSSSKRTKEWRVRHNASQASRDDLSVSVTRPSNQYSPFEEQNHGDRRFSLS